MITEFTIKRSEWLHGEGAVRSYLLRREDGKKCCLGFYSLACGLEIANIAGSSTPLSIANLPAEMKWLMKDPGRSEVARKLMARNDRRDLNEEARERGIADLFASQGIKVTFVD